MDTKKCPRCKDPKPLKEFAWKNKKKGTKQSQCHPCRRESAKESYQRHRKKIIAKRTARGKRLGEEYKKWKETLSCELCGEDEGVCIDFHHKDPETKEYEVSKMRGNTLKRIMREVAKCMTVCANCHRKIHKYGLTQAKKRIKMRL